MALRLLGLLQQSRVSRARYSVCGALCQNAPGHPAETGFLDAAAFSWDRKVWIDQEMKKKMGF